MKTLLDTGCHIIANAVKAAKVDVVSAYPITPQTSVVEEIASMVENGEMDCRFLPVEGEHSAMAACVAASATGARVFTATSSQGLLYMHEILHMASGGRFPIVMANINRAVFAPWSIFVDHNDSLSQRDTGWLQLYCGSLQEAYNTTIQAYKIAETVNLPVMVNLDGFILSHCIMNINTPPQEVIDSYLGVRKPLWVLDPKNPNVYSAVTPENPYAHYRATLQRDIMNSFDIIADAAKEYRDLTGMWNGDFFETYKCEDAEIFVLSMGSMATEMRLSIDRLRKEGLKIGSIRLRLYRPFPGEYLSRLLPSGSTLVVLDRNYSFGMGCGILGAECKTALYERASEIEIKNKSIGIGGQDLPGSFMADEIKKLLSREA